MFQAAVPILARSYNQPFFSDIIPESVTQYFVIQRLKERVVGKSYPGLAVLDIKEVRKVTHIQKDLQRIMIQDSSQSHQNQTQTLWVNQVRRTPWTLGTVLWLNEACKKSISLAYSFARSCFSFFTPTKVIRRKDNSWQMVKSYDEKHFSHLETQIDLSLTFFHNITCRLDTDPNLKFFTCNLPSKTIAYFFSQEIPLTRRTFLEALTFYCISLCLRETSERWIKSFYQRKVGQAVPDVCLLTDKGHTTKPNPPEL